MTKGLVLKVIEKSDELKVNFQCYAQMCIQWLNELKVK